MIVGKISTFNRRDGARMNLTMCIHPYYYFFNWRPIIFAVNHYFSYFVQGFDRGCNIYFGWFEAW